MNDGVLSKSVSSESVNQLVSERVSVNECVSE